MLQPKKTKYKKYQKRYSKCTACRGNILFFGYIGIKSISNKMIYLTDRQIEAARVAATRYMKREGKLFINIFPYKPITKKPQEVRMGKGKGSIDHWATPVRPGKILFEIYGVKLDIAIEALRLCSNKLPMKTKYVYNSINVNY